MTEIPTAAPGVANFTAPGFQAGDPWEAYWEIETALVPVPDPANPAHWAPYTVAGGLWRSQVRATEFSSSELLGEWTIDLDAALYGANVVHGILAPDITTAIGRRKLETVFYDLQEERDKGPRTWVRGRITVLPETTVTA